MTNKLDYSLLNYDCLILQELTIHFKKEYTT